MNSDSEHHRRMGSDRKGLTEYCGPGGALRLLWIRVLFAVGLDLTSFKSLLNEFVHKTYGAASAKPGSAKVSNGRIDQIHTLRANLRRSLTQHQELTFKKLIQGLKILGMVKLTITLDGEFKARDGHPPRKICVSIPMNLGKVSVEAEPSDESTGESEDG